MKEWVVRAALLLAMAGGLAIVHAAIQPVPRELQPGREQTAQPAPPQEEEEEESASPSEPSPEEAEDPAPEGPDADGNVDDLDWVVEHYNNQTAQFVDARPERYYTEAHIPGSFHLSFGEFQSGKPAVVELLRGYPLIIYCSGGDCDSSHKVRTMLKSHGFEEVYVFEGGFPAWEKAGMPTEQGPPQF